MGTGSVEANMDTRKSEGAGSCVEEEYRGRDGRYRGFVARGGQFWEKTKEGV